MKKVKVQEKTEEIKMKGVTKKKKVDVTSAEKKIKMKKMLDPQESQTTVERKVKSKFEGAGSGPKKKRSDVLKEDNADSVEMSKNLIKVNKKTKFENNLQKMKVGKKKKNGGSTEKTDAKKGVKKSKNKLENVNGKNKHKSSLKGIEGLKDIDPEFYEFLKKNDKKLLEFNVLDSDEEDVSDDETRASNVKDSRKNDMLDNSEDDNDDVDSVDINEEKYHKPDANLEVASDESDFEDEDENKATGADGVHKVSLNLLRQWQLQLEKANVTIDVIRKVIQAFSSALASLSTDGEQGHAPTVFKVVGAGVFNGVVQLCVLHLQQAILRFLGVSARPNVPLHKTKKWEKIRGCLRYYLTDLIRLIEQVSSSNILSVLLKHLHQMAGMVASFSTLGKTILKRLIVLWSTGDETVRVLAFLCILKITRNQQLSMLHHVLKAMYLSYVRNSKFVSPNTLPAINFMRRSLVEMFALDLNVSYHHVFLYIRQLAIHQRNAVILKKKDSFQAVYNWQYINSIRLWADLLATTSNKPQLQPLLYPFVTITIGALRLIPTAQYFPLRFHCLQALITLSKETHIYMPILPLILEVLRSKTFNSKHTVVSMKPLQFTCILRLNKSQLAENGFRDEVVEQICALLLEYCAYESASLAFSDLVVPSVVHLKAYIKDCRNANYSRKLKQLLDKIQENQRFIDQERRKINFSLKDLVQVQAWETQLRNKGTPLSIYYNSWVKTHETKKRRQAAQADSINDDYNLPMIKRKSVGPPVKDINGEVELFPSESEDDVPAALQSDEDNKTDVLKQKVKKTKKIKKTKKAKQTDDNPVTTAQSEEFLNDSADNIDIVKDLNLDDW
ncbi:nucleolar complex protein 2 homolog [Teleopsis dalmanni]|uniref:nucleolar complex protein 2 homolog n=1 Tax=Teleopsis dalmanni TaxID=139649 RepID=UPI000D32CBD4|nr:nucleolar complex protein 2 homolog [Teleopsis dalmanni]